MKEVVRCSWARNELAIRYHDEEWGVPVHDDRIFFEFLTLEGAQAGLSWDTILQKRENYRKAFAGFDPAKVAEFDRKKQAKLLLDPGIVRNRLKVSATVDNARAFLLVQNEFESFDARGREAQGEPGKNRSGQHAGIRCNEQGVEEAGIPVCGLDDLLCLHAGNRAGQ
jgi:DNA-3-methyladenine glycosylase I